MTENWWESDPVVEQGGNAWWESDPVVEQSEQPAIAGMPGDGPEWKTWEPSLLDQVKGLFGSNRARAAVEAEARRIASEQGVSTEEAYQAAGGMRPLLNPEGRAPIQAGVDAAGVLGEQVPNILPAAANTVLRAVRGGDIDTEDGALDRLIQGTETGQPEYIDPNYDSLYGVGESLGYSLVTLASSITAGIAGSATPAGPVGGFAAGMAASGTVSYRASKDDFLSRVKDKLDAGSVAVHGRPLNAEEWGALAADFDSAAVKYGAWEAIPEAVSNLIFVKALAAPLKGKTGGALKAAAQRAGAVIGQSLPSEHVTETTTGVGQNRAELEAGLTDRRLSVGDAFRQQAVPTTIVTLGMAGAGAAGKGAQQVASKQLDKRNPSRVAGRELSQAVDSARFTDADYQAQQALDPSRGQVQAPQGAATADPVQAAQASNPDPIDEGPNDSAPDNQQDTHTTAEVADFSRQRLAELEAKAQDTQTLTPDEFAEREFLRDNGDDLQKVAAAYGVQISDAPEQGLKARDEKYSDDQGEKPADNKTPGLSTSREAPLPKAGEPVPPAGEEPAQATRPVQKPQVPGQVAPANEAPNGESILGDENRRPFDSLKLPVADISLSKDVPNFKAGANESGVVEPLGGTFDDTGVAPIIVWQRKNGDYEVVSGRHRLDLAKRSGTKEIDAQVFREVDGYNREWAKQIDAELNIRDENGEVRDYANYFRARGESRESAEAKSLLSRRKGRDGFDIAEGATDLLFESLQAEETSERAAAEISRKAPRNEPLQAMAMQQLKAGKGLNTALGMIEAVQAMQAAGRVKQSDQGDLFGMDDSAMKEAEQMAKDANKIRNQIRSQINSAKGASKNPAAAKKLGVDVKDPDAVRKKLTELEALAKRWENWPTDRELREQLSGATEQAPQAEPQESKPKPQDSPKPAPQAETKPPALELSAQTEAELAAADAKKKANEAKAKEAERKQKIQDQADDFALTDPGMNQEQAELEARGQTNLFDQPEPAKAKEPQAPDTPIEAAAAETNTNPTQGQIEAGNYRKGTVQLHGLTIAIENPKGSTRRGVDPDGKAWETTMNQHYGYIKSTKGADGEAVDVFLGPNAEDASYPVFVIDQVDASGKFDEHKVMLGFRNQKQARDAYKSNYQDGWKVGPTKRMTLDEFKQWLETGARKPAVTSAEKPAEPKAKPKKTKKPESKVSKAPESEPQPASSETKDQPDDAANEKSGDELADINLDDLADLIDAELRGPEAAETHKPEKKRAAKTSRGQPRKTRSRAETQPQTIGGAFKDAGVDLGSAGLDALKGLHELFNSKNTLNSGLIFTEESYQRAKPHFQAAWERTKSAGLNLKDFIRLILAEFGSGAKPFILRFAADYQAELKGETQNNQDERQAQISSADRVPVELANLENIRETLPTLLPEQQEDVAFVERRFKKPDGHGALITNGTGTGKTYSGLGVVKRYQRQGKNNILIITPSEAINNAWLRSAPDVGVTMRALVDTKDAGEATVITTYANFYQNMELVHREWDLIVADEAHHLRRKDDLTPTKREHMLGALSYHPRFDMRRFEFIHREQYDERREVRASIHSKEAIRGLADTRDDQRQQLQREIDELKDRETAITGELTAAWEKARPEYAAKWEANTTQVLMLSATPFAYVKAVDMAEGYLFKYPEVGESSAYNAPGSQDAFFMGEFGFRKRYNKLTQPDAGVDRALMERQFNEKLKRDGVVRGRALEVEKDYDRKFIITPESSGITAGAEYDAAIDWIEEHKEALSEDRESVDYQAYELIQRLFERKRDYLQMVYMLEAMKAEAAIPYIEKHLALGRKVIVFHDYNKGGSRDPLRIQAAQSQAQELLKAAGDSATFEFENREYDTKAFRNAWKDFIKDNARIFDRELFYYPAPQTLFKNHFGDDALFFNGTVPSKQKMEAIRLFNQDGSGKNLLIAQLDAMQEGVSAHDTTGEHQRVLINIGLMNKPTAAIQTEGRIYRVGLKSDAAFRYPTTGLTLEDYLVSRSATRAGTAENLGMGEQARGLEESFRLAYESASYSEPNPKEGKGGKAADRKLAKVTTPFEIAKTRYYGSQKVTGRRNQREGEDFYPTPDPVGLKMVEWANLQPEERALEPSAGAGAILQWFPERVTAQFVEPFTGLYTKAQLKSPNAEHRPGSFEELDIRNKYDAIVMNPPFGQGGAKAFRHVTKALGHLSDGGRVVALVPKGPSADKAYGKFLEALPDNMFVRAEIALPASTFEKASTSILTQVLVIDRSDVEGASYNTKRVNFTGSDTVGEFFDRLEEFDLSLPRAEKKPVDEAPAVEGLAALDTTHGRTGEPLYVVELGQRLGDEEYSALSAKAKAAGGFPIKAKLRRYYSGAAGIPAFDFRGDKGARDKFLAEAGAPMFSLGDVPASGMTKRDTQSIVDEVAAGWLGAPDTRVVQSIEQLPRKVYAHAERRGALSKLRAVYWEGTLYIVADRMADRVSVEKALLHEGLGHFGVRSVLGNGLEPYLNQVYLALGSSPEARRIRQDYFGSNFDANNRKHRLEVAEELIAHLAESGKHRKLWGRIVSFVRDRLRAMGFTLQINEADLLDLLRQAEAVVKNGGISLAEGSPVMSIGADIEAEFKATEEAYGGKEAWQKARDAGKTKLNYRQWVQVRTPAFKNWFGDWENANERSGKTVPGSTEAGQAIGRGVESSSEADARATGTAGRVWRLDRDTGEPRVFHHGTADKFTAFDLSHHNRKDKGWLGRGVYTTSDNRLAKRYAKMKARAGGDQRVLDLFANVRSPYVASHDYKQALRFASQEYIDRATVELKELGHDGVVLEFHDGTLELVAFDPSDVKSATDNIGSFDPENDDIRFMLVSGGFDPESANRVTNSTKYTPPELEALQKFGLAPKEKQDLANKISQTMNKSRLKVMKDDLLARANEGLFEGLAGWRRAEQEVGVDSPAKSGYLSARLASGVSDVMTALLKYGAPMWQGNVLVQKPGTKGLLEVLGEAGQDLNAWLAWMGANRAQELMKQGREKNLTQADIDALLGMAKGKEAKFERIRQQYLKLNRAMLDMAVGAGTLDQDARLRFESDWYVPFYRAADAEGVQGVEIIGPTTRRGFSHQSAAIRALRGSEMGTNDLLENIITNWLKLVDSSMKNKALLLGVDNLKGTRFLRNETFKYQKAVVPRSEIAKRIQEDREALISVAESLGMPGGSSALEVADELMKPENEGFEKLWAVVAPKDPDVIRVQRKGKNEYYKVLDPALLRAITHMNSVGSNDILTKTGRQFKRLLTTAVTASPEFMLRNFIRDAVHAWAINPDGFKFGTDSIKGVKAAFKEDADYRALMFAGASFQGGYVHGTDPDASAQLIRRALRAKGLTTKQRQSYMDSLIQTPGQSWAVVLKGWEWYRGVGDRIENSNRLSTYKRALAAGKPISQALFEAKDLMDYSQRGNFQALVLFTDLIAFLNARMQGGHKLGRASRDNPRRVFLSAGLRIAAFSVALALLNDDNEEYQQLPDWDKDANWHFFIGGHHFRIPKPFEIGIMFGTIPERLTHVFIGNQPTEKLAWSLKHNIVATFNVNPIPQALLPVAEVAANRSFFFDMPIEGMADEGKLPEARYSEHTSDLMRKLGEWTGTSPKKLEHLYNGYLGTLGSYILTGADAMARFAVDGPEKPDLGIEDYWVVRAVYRGSGPAKSTQYQTDVYDRANEVEQLYRTINAYQMEGEHGKAHKLESQNISKLHQRAILNRARRQLSDINAEIRAVSRSRISGEAKRRQLEALRKQKNDVTSQVEKMTRRAFSS